MVRPVSKGEFALNDNKEFVTLRIVFEKCGRARYISHLDLNRAMTRAVRRAAIPLWYTEGFNKHPYLTFAAPLSLGFEGERETVDLRLIEDMPPQEVVQRLNAVLPEGIQAVSAAPAVKKAGDVAQAVYRLTMGCTAADVESLLAQPSVTVQKRNKKKEWKPVELKPVLEAAGGQVNPCAGGVQWELTLPCSSEQSVNPSLVIAALREHTGREFPCTVRRLRVLAKDGTEFL